MREQMETASLRPIEGALEALYGAAPDATFVAGLERRLFAEASTVPACQGEDSHREGREGHKGEGSNPLATFASFAVQDSRRRWALGAAAVALVLLSALAAAGPARVWAQVQRLLGYVPGVGFVDLDRARVLAAPVSVTRGGVTLTVEQAVARPDGTTIAIHAEGLPPAGEVWPQGARQEPGGELTLRLQDGSVLVQRACELRYGEGRFEFPPLPAGVYRATLVLPRLPLVPAGAAPEGWEVPLALQPATGELAAALFPQPYQPEGAADSHDGITVRVLDVAQGPAETALRLALDWQDASAYPFAAFGNAYLRDDLGHAYWPAGRPGSGSFVETEVIAIDPSAPRPTPAPASREETIAFSPVSPQAHELTLVVEQIDMRVPAKAAFSVDLGESPQVGDSWPLDLDLEVAGLPVHVVAAQLVEEVTGTREAPELRSALELVLVQGPGAGTRTLTSLTVDSGAARFESGGSRYSGTTGRLRASLRIAEGQPLPSGRIELTITSAIVTLRGPWTVRWPVPGADEAGAGPAVLHPAASARRGDITLALDEAVLSDRLTSVRLALTDAPAGVTLSGMDTFAGTTPGERATLTDDRGRDYGLPNSAGVGWRPAGERAPDLDALAFAPLKPFARRLTLRLPVLRLAWAGAAAFDVDVPAGVALAPAGDGRPWLVSEPWAVDIPLEVAGYRLRLAEARLEDNGVTTMLRLTSAPYTPAQDRQLTGLRPATISGPGGAVDVASVMSTAGPASEGAAQHQAMLLFDVSGPDGRVQPGRYHVELSGATVAVRGPWVLSWEAAGR